MASAVPLIRVSLGLHPKLFHEFQPMGGVAPRTVDPPVPPVAVPVPPPVAEPPRPATSPPLSVAPASRPPVPAPPEPVEPPAPPPVPLPAVPPLGAAPPVLVEPPLAVVPPEPPDLPPVAFPPVEVAPPVDVFPPELVAPPDPDVPPLAWPPPDPPFEGPEPDDPEQPAHTGAKATTTDSSATFTGTTPWFGDRWAIAHTGVWLARMIASIELSLRRYFRAKKGDPVRGRFSTTICRENRLLAYGAAQQYTSATFVMTPVLASSESPLRTDQSVWPLGRCP